jgi:hypothetical protein
MRPLLLLAAIALLLATPVAASGADFKNGDVLVGTSIGTYNVYDNGGTLLETIDQAVDNTVNPREAVDCAFDRSGVLYTTAFRFSRLVRFLGPAPHNQLPPVTTGPSPESVSFARDGSFYVGHQSNPNSLRKFNSAGAPIANFSPARPAALIDLSADQRTVFYTDRTNPTPSVVHRFDVEANADLPDFADLGGTDRIADVKLLPPGDGSGGAIVAQTTTIKRVNGDGDVVATYDRAGEDTWFGIALDPDGKSFWAQTATPGNVYRFNIATGVVDRGPLPSAASAFGICVKGSRTAALDNAAPSISITTPAEGATFQQGQDVKAAFTCEDDRNGTGIGRCTGTVPAGTSIDTGSPGTKTFSVEAVDNAGNTATASRTYNVVAPPPPPPPPPVALKRIIVTLSSNFPSVGKTIRFTRLVVKNVPRGSTVTATCRTKQGRRCRGIKKFTKRNARGTVKLKRFLRKTLRVGTVIEVRVTKPGMIGAVKRLTVRRGKNPTITTRCLPPGAKKPTRC